MKVFLGFFWLAALFALCFLTVHTVLYLLHEKAFFSARKPSERQPQQSVCDRRECEQNRSAEKEENEPIYFIVEKKSRKKNTYSKPRQIKFQ